VFDVVRRPCSDFDMLRRLINCIIIIIIIIIISCGIRQLLYVQIVTYVNCTFQRLRGIQRSWYNNKHVETELVVSRKKYFIYINEKHYTLYILATDVEAGLYCTKSLKD